MRIGAFLLIVAPPLPTLPFVLHALLCLIFICLLVLNSWHNAGLICCAERRTGKALSEKFFHNFLHRNHGLAQRRVQLFDARRANASTVEHIANWHCNIYMLLRMLEQRQASVISILNLDELNFCGNNVHGRRFRTRFLGNIALPFDYKVSVWRESWTWTSCIANDGKIFMPMITLKNKVMTKGMVTSLLHDPVTGRDDPDAFVLSWTDSGMVRFEQWCHYVMHVRFSPLPLYFSFFLSFSLSLSLSLSLVLVCSCCIVWYVWYLCIRVCL